MLYTKFSHTIKSSDNIHTLNGIAYVPIGEVKATMQIIHGMCEHIELYDEFMSTLAQNGIFAFAHDQLGHGRTAENIESLGFFAEENGEELLVEDAHNFANEFIGNFPNVRHFVFSHSMGTFIARLCVEKYPDIADGVIFSGTSGPQKAAALGIAWTDLKSRVRGADHRSESVQNLFYGMYNSEFKDEENDYSWLTTDETEIRKHEQDEYFNFTFSVKAMNDVVRLCHDCNTDQWFENYPESLPTLIISGEQDPLGNFGKGVLEVYRRLHERAGDNVVFKLYSGARHELLNEECRFGVTADILTWAAAYRR